MIIASRKATEELGGMESEPQSENVQHDSFEDLFPPSAPQISLPKVPTTASTGRVKLTTVEPPIDPLSTNSDDDSMEAKSTQPPFTQDSIRPTVADSTANIVRSIAPVEDEGNTHTHSHTFVCRSLTSVSFSDDLFAEDSFKVQPVKSQLPAKKAKTVATSLFPVESDDEEDIFAPPKKLQIAVPQIDIPAAPVSVSNGRGNGTSEEDSPSSDEQAQLPMNSRIKISAKLEGIFAKVSPKSDLLTKDVSKTLPSKGLTSSDDDEGKF